MKVLIDHSVRQRGILGKHGVVGARNTLDGKPYTYLKFKTRNRPKRLDWLQEEIETISTVSELIRTGKVQAFSTNELCAEYFRAAKYPSPKYIDVFEGCRFSDLLPPRDRSKWGLSLEQYFNKGEVIAYCKSFVLDPSQERIENFIDAMKGNPSYSLTPFEEKCLRRASVFEDLCRGILEKHYPDALHLWTAEENGLDGFLTLDRKFRNVVERQHVRLACNILYPSEMI